MEGRLCADFGDVRRAWSTRSAPSADSFAAAVRAARQRHQCAIWAGAPVAPASSVPNSPSGSTSGNPGGSTTKKAPPVEVPELAGSTSDKAAGALTDLGLSAKVTEVVDNRVLAGTVVRSDPVSGKKVKTDSTVTLLVSRGPTAPLDLIGTASSAIWVNGSGTSLQFDGNDGDTAGFVFIGENHSLEDNTLASRLLETHPVDRRRRHLRGLLPRHCRH